jgi:2OG-Fe(II) oxygenase superfamily
VPIFDLSGFTDEKAAEEYRLARPFPHAMFTDVVRLDPEEVVAAFPDKSWEGWADRSSKFQPGKSSCRDIGVMPPLLARMIHELSEPAFLRALSTLIGIDNLLPDPFLEGGGLQWTGPGGKLLPHTDFHNHPRMPLYRRANVLLFLNPDWEPGDGGELCLFNLGEEAPAARYEPRFGTCIAFTTDHRSVHGVTAISEGAHMRRSIALYYYTVESAEVFSGDRSTWWYDPEAPVERSPATRARLAAMKTALKASRTLTRLAYRVDPQKPELVGPRPPGS